MANMEKLVAVIILDLVETPYHGPTRPSIPEDYISNEDRDVKAQNSPCGPSTHSCDNLSWIGSIKCTINVIIKNDINHLRVEQVVQSTYNGVQVPH